MGFPAAWMLGTQHRVDGRRQVRAPAPSEVCFVCLVLRLAESLSVQWPDVFGFIDSDLLELWDQPSNTDSQTLLSETWVGEVCLSLHGVYSLESFFIL